MTQWPHTAASQAAIYAVNAHRGQVRKYTGAPYIVHPAEVAQLVAEYAAVEGDNSRDVAIAAAFLHDVVEDTDMTVENIRSIFGENIARVVEELTEVPTEGNRYARKKAEAQRPSKIGWVAREVKLADLISNTRDIVRNDPKFATVYLSEKFDVLNALHRGEAGRTVLYRKAWDAFYQGIDDLEAMGVNVKAPRQEKEKELVD